MKTLAIISLLVGLLSIPAASTAAPPAKADDVTKHLEFLGYKVTVKSKRMMAKHSKYLNIFLKKYRGGILLTSYFLTSEYGKANKDKLLVIVNDLNRGAAASRFYLDKAGDLVIEAYYPGDYSKETFNTFIETYNLSGPQLGRKAKEIRLYLK